MQGKLRPDPKQWFHSPSDYELKIPKSLPLVYTQLPFYLNGLTNTTEIKKLISAVRTVCEKFENRGLANYPSGIPFIFWEQYMDLRPSLYIIVGLALLAALVLISILLLSLYAALLVVFNAVATLLQLLAVMTYLGINLSALSAVILVLSVGFSVCFTVHVSLVSILLVFIFHELHKVVIAHDLLLTPNTYFYRVSLRRWATKTGAFGSPYRTHCHRSSTAP